MIDELTRVLEFNDQVRRLRAIVDSARPQIDQLVSNVVTTTFDRPIASAQLRAWREQVNSHVARDAGFAYQAYVRLKLASVRAFGAELIVKLRGVPAQSPLWRVVTEIIDAWALAKGMVYERADSEALEFEVQTGAHLPAWVKYLLAFDVKYRARRMHFLIKGQNRLYQLIDQEHFRVAIHRDRKGQPEHHSRRVRPHGGINEIADACKLNDLIEHAVGMVPGRAQQGRVETHVLDPGQLLTETSAQFQ